MSSGSEDRSPSPVASRRAAAAAAADMPRRRCRKAKRDRSRSPSYLSLRERDRDRNGVAVADRRSRSVSPRRRRRRYFDDQVERRSFSPLRRRRARSESDSDRDDEEEPDRRNRSRSRSPRRGRAPRSCRSRSRTRSEECENRQCCRRSSRSPGDDGDGDSDGESPPPEEAFDLRIDRSDDLFKCANCSELLSSPVYECVDGHVTCAVCHGSTNKRDDGVEGDDMCSKCRSTDYRRSRAVAGWLSSILFPCGNHGHGCPAFLPRHEIDAHERACNYAPVFCPADFHCDFPGGPTDALERHVQQVHGWSVAGVRYGEPLHVRVRPAGAGAARTLLRAEDDGALFYLCARPADHGAASVLSMIRIRPDDDGGGSGGAPAAGRFTYEVKTPPEAPGMGHRMQMQSTVWGTSLRDGVLYANPVDIKVPGSMLPREGPQQDSVEVRIVKAASVNSN